MEFFQEDGDINDEASDVLLGQNTQARSFCCNVTHHNSRLDHERNDDSFTVLIFLCDVVLLGLVGCVGSQAVYPGRK